MKISVWHLLTLCTYSVASSDHSVVFLLYSAVCSDSSYLLEETVHYAHILVHCTVLHTEGEHHLGRLVC